MTCCCAATEIFLSSCLDFWSDPGCKTWTQRAFNVLTFKFRVPSNIWFGVQAHKQVNWHNEEDGSFQRLGSSDLDRDKVGRVNCLPVKEQLGVKNLVCDSTVLPARSLLILTRSGWACALSCAVLSQAQHMLCCYQPYASCGSRDDIWSSIKLRAV